MASIPDPSKGDNVDDSYEEEVFFGQLTDQELKLARRLLKRRTELYIPSFRSRPSLAEFRHGSNYLPITENDSSIKSDDDFGDSLEEKSFNNTNISGSHNKPCEMVDAEDDFSNSQAAIKNNDSSESTTYYSAVSEVDHSVVSLEGLLNKVDRISSASAPYHSAASEANSCISYLEDSLNAVGRISSASRIELANDSLEIHERRRSCIRLSDATVRHLVFENEEPGVSEIVSESSIEQDSLPVNWHEKQMECLDVKDDNTNELSKGNSEEEVECNMYSDNSPSSKLAAKNSFAGIYEQTERTVEDMAVNTFASAVLIKQCEKLSNERDSALPLSPTSEISLYSILSEDSMHVIPAQGRAAGDDCTSFQNPCAFLDKNEETELLTSPLMSSCIAKNNTPADGKSFTENSVVSELLAPTDADGSPVHKHSKLSMTPTEKYDQGSESLKDDGILIVCPPSDEWMNQHAVVAHQGTITTSSQPESLPRCVMVDHATSYCQSDEHKIDAKDQGCQTSFLGLAGTVAVAETVDRAFGDAPSMEDRVSTCGTPLSSQMPQRIPLYKAAIGQPGREPIFKTPTNPPMRVSASAQTAGKGTTAPKASPMQFYTPTEAALSEVSSMEDRASTRGTPLSSKKQQRIPLCRAAAGQPAWEPIFKTPTKPAMRVPASSVSAGKSSTTPKASSVQSRTPTEAGKRLAIPTKSRFAHITSPIAKYINESAVPPLISNSRPIVSRSSKLKITPITKIPVPNSSTKQPRLTAVSSEDKRILVSCTRSSKTKLPVVKAKKLNFVCTSEESKENMYIEDSILEELKISLKELHEINNKKLKKDVLDYIKTRMAMIVNVAKEINVPSESGQNCISIPCLSYKGASSLATRQVDLVTKLHTVKNKNIVCSPVQPTILKHTGERKVLHWANGLVSEVDSLSSPFHAKIIAPAIFMKTAHKSSRSSDSNESTIDVSIVEVVNPARTNTLSKQ